MGFLEKAIQFARFECARIEDIEMSNSDIREFCLDEVVETFSEMVPQTEAHTVTLVAGQSFYDLPDPNILTIKEYSTPFYSGIASYLGSDYGTTYPSTYAGYGAAHYSSGVVESYARQQHNPKDRIEVYIQGGRIEVYPTPEKGHTLHLLCTMMWEFADDAAYDNIARRLRKGFRYLMCWAVAKKVAQEWSRLPEVKVQGSRVRVNWENMKVLANEMFQAAKDSFPEAHGAAVLQG